MKGTNQPPVPAPESKKKTSASDSPNAIQPSCFASFQSQPLDIDFANELEQCLANLPTLDSLADDDVVVVSPCHSSLSRRKKTRPFLTSFSSLSQVHPQLTTL